MKYYIGLFLGVWLLFSVTPSAVHANIKINEIAWMGTTASQYSEWIELYNSGLNDISLAGWKLYKTGDQLFFTLSKTIAANGYLLIERTTASAPDAVPGINDESGVFAGGGLRNSGEDITLKDKDGNTIDSVAAAAGWPAGDAKTKNTMQWNGSHWITAPGTPDAVNAATASSSDNTETNTQTATATLQNIPISSPVTTNPPTSLPVQNTPVLSTTTVPTTPLVTTVPLPVPVVTVPVSSTTPIPSTTVPVAITPIDNNSAKKTVVKNSNKKVKKTFTVQKSTTIGKDTVANDTAADQLQQSTDTTAKENNHSKIFILGAVVLIGIALFLLLARFMVSKE